MRRRDPRLSRTRCHRGTRRACSSARYDSREGQLEHEPVQAAVLTILDQEDASTSVKLEAISVLETRMDNPDVRRIVSAALTSSNSTSVALRAVETLGAHASESDSRIALVRALDSDYSTSVALASISALSPYVDRDSSVRDAFVRTMEDRKMSSTARIRCAERLVPGSDAALKTRIADAMEDVIVRIRRRGRGHRDTIEDALDILEIVDPERAKSLRARGQVRNLRSATPSDSLFFTTAAAL